MHLGSRCHTSACPLAPRTGTVRLLRTADTPPPTFTKELWPGRPSLSAISLPSLREPPQEAANTGPSRLRENPEFQVLGARHGNTLSLPGHPAASPPQVPTRHLHRPRSESTLPVSRAPYVFTAPLGLTPFLGWGRHPEAPRGWQGARTGTQVSSHEPFPPVRSLHILQARGGKAEGSPLLTPGGQGLSGFKILGPIRKHPHAGSEGPTPSRRGLPLESPPRLRPTYAQTPALIFSPALPAADGVGSPRRRRVW